MQMSNSIIQHIPFLLFPHIPLIISILLFFHANI